MGLGGGVRDFQLEGGTWKHSQTVCVPGLRSVHVQQYHLEPVYVCVCVCVCSHVFILCAVHLDTHVNVRDLGLGAKGAGRGGELDY